MVWAPVKQSAPPPDDFVYYIPIGGLGIPQIEVFEGNYRRKITQEGWRTIERYFSVKWFDVLVIGGDKLHGQFELHANGRCLTKLQRGYVLKKSYNPNGCPKCGNPGKFIRMALVCPNHGAFGGC